MTVFYCPGAPPNVLPLTAPLAVGFGVVTVRKDGTSIWSGDDEHRWLRRYERMAAADPEHDWRVEFHGPMSSQTYQRRGEGTWLLIETGRGFA